jgi:hypothetical protein
MLLYSKRVVDIIENDYWDIQRGVELAVPLNNAKYGVDR